MKIFWMAVQPKPSNRFFSQCTAIHVPLNGPHASHQIDSIPEPKTEEDARNLVDFWNSPKGNNQWEYTFIGETELDGDRPRHQRQFRYGEE